jgi:hypothetical protein
MLIPEALTQLQSKLRKMNLGIDAWVTLSETGVSGTPGRDSAIRKMLGYAKTSDGWGFVVKDVRVESGFYEGDTTAPWQSHYEQDEPKLLLKCSREVRTQAAPRVGDLLNALQAEANEAIKALQQARKLAEQV